MNLTPMYVECLTHYSEVIPSWHVQTKKVPVTTKHVALAQSLLQALLLPNTCVTPGDLVSL
jgi:hypothetical protein